MARFLAICVTAALLGGCATANKMEPPSSRLWRLAGNDKDRAAIEAALTDQDIALMLEARITARLPAKLAIAGVSSSYHGLTAESVSESELKGWQESLGGIPGIKGIEGVSPMMNESGNSLRALRAAAARMGCELLLVYTKATSSVDNYNDAAVLYWTFVGLWLVPGSVYEQKTLAQAMVLDCRTGMILGTAAGDGYVKSPYAAAYGQIVRDKANSQTPAKAIEALQKNAATMMRRVVQSASAAASQPAG